MDPGLLHTRLSQRPRPQTPKIIGCGLYHIYSNVYNSTCYLIALQKDHCCPDNQPGYKQCEDKVTNGLQILGFMTAIRKHVEGNMAYNFSSKEKRQNRQITHIVKLIKVFTNK